MAKQGVGITITQHILNQQRQKPEATGGFTTLLYELIVAAKVISREVNKAGLADILGSTGKINIQDEQVQKLDVFSDQIIIERMQHIGQKPESITANLSEEVPFLYNCLLILEFIS